MSEKSAAIQAAVNAVAAATRAANTYGRNSQKARIAYEAAMAEVRDARMCGATDAEIRAARPA
ncbi:hypothetical protein ACFVAF_25400 [Streptomyces sp. NPDC057596]|uniref:hypothetical protein n=1 Tax=Streptomyces sp. NPDC057596 TaxID=3346178 RepID=UPI0036CAD1D6